MHSTRRHKKVASTSTPTATVDATAAAAAAAVAATSAADSRNTLNVIKCTTQRKVAERWGGATGKRAASGMALCLYNLFLLELM